MGPTGGIVAAEALRPHLSELGCLPVSHMVSVPSVCIHNMFAICFLCHCMLTIYSLSGDRVRKMQTV